MRPEKRARLRIAVALVVAVLFLVHWLPHPESLPLATRIDGPPPNRAAGLVVFLHGRGGSLRRMTSVAAQLREAGLPPDVAIAFVEAPYSTWFGHQWGSTAETQAKSRARIRALMRDWLGDSGPPRDRIVVAGFSQGAGVALDLAVEETRIGRVASFSPCLSILRGELPKRTDLRTFLAHGKSDAVCPVEESRSLARMLEAAHRPVQYLEFDGQHTMPREMVRAFVAFVTAP